MCLVIYNLSVIVYVLIDLFIQLPDKGVLLSIWYKGIDKYLSVAK